MITLLFMLLSALSQPSISKAELQSSIVRFRPGELPGVPRNVADELQRRNCMIPMMDYGGKRETNVIHGQFAASVRQDWAALCSRNGKNFIVVIWGGTHDCPSEFEAISDEAYLQIDIDRRTHFSRLITRVKPKKLRLYLQDNQEKPKFAIRHDGVADAFVGKASVVHYCHAGKWKKLQGSD